MLSSSLSQRPHVATQPAFRAVRAILVSVGVGALSAACSATAADGPRDVGNMAYPQPLAQGNLSTTSVAGRGSPDTGNMAYPTPLPAGNGPVTAVK